MCLVERMALFAGVLARVDDVLCLALTERGMKLLLLAD